jgi:hypothetical protein
MPDFFGRIAILQGSFLGGMGGIRYPTGEESRAMRQEYVTSAWRVTNYCAVGGLHRVRTIASARNSFYFQQMPDSLPARRLTSLIRPLSLALAGLCVLGVAIWLGRNGGDDASIAKLVSTVSAPSVVASAPVKPAAPSVPAAVAPVGMKEPVKPSFDIVRVSPTGEAVVAGRAEPGATVAVTSNGTEIGRVQADAAGQFVILPSKPLPSGGQALELSARSGAGPESQAVAPVLVVVPDRPVLAAGLKPVATGDASLSGPKLGLAVQASKARSGLRGRRLRVLSCGCISTMRRLEMRRLMLPAIGDCRPRVRCRWGCIGCGWIRSEPAERSWRARRFRSSGRS